MYKSPIEITNSFSDSLLQRFSDETDKIVLTAMFNLGVKVDKAELIKALEYDRDQYEKGYMDGKEAANELYKQIKWERDVAIETLHEHGIELGERAQFDTQETHKEV